MPVRGVHVANSCHLAFGIRHEAENDLDNRVACMSSLVDLFITHKCLVPKFPKMSAFGKETRSSR